MFQAPKNELSVVYAKGNIANKSTKKNQKSRGKLKPVPRNVQSTPAPISKALPQSTINLIVHHGNVWAAKIPEGWATSETDSGIDIYDPKDDMKTGVSSIVAIGWFGNSSPDKFIDWVLASIGATGVKYISESNEAAVRDSSSGRVWNMKTKIIVFTDSRGRQIQAKASAGVINGCGQYIAMFSAFQTTPDKWNNWALVLERVAKSIVIINPSKAGGIDKVKLPTAADLANDSSPLMEAWEYRNRVNDKTSHEWSDAMLGRESGLISPSTGTRYTVPLTSYDPTIGGYRNPNNASEILHDPYAD